jgi:hypothetical protein
MSATGRQTKATGWEMTPARRAAVERAHDAARAKGAGRLQDYTELRAQGLTIAQAAERMCVSMRSAKRYEAGRIAGAS